jgi:hypothetical protein
VEHAVGGIPWPGFVSLESKTVKNPKFPQK